MFGVPKFTISRNSDIISNTYCHVTLPPISYQYKEDSVIILQRLWRWKKYVN